MRRAPLLTAKLLYFFWFGAISCLLPYLTLHMRHLGVPAWDAAVISGILPILQLLACPLACFLPSLASSYKKAVITTLLIVASSALLLLLSPEAPRPKREMVSMHLECGPSVRPHVIVDKCQYECDSGQFEDGVDVLFTECHVDCPDQRGGLMNIADLCFDDDHGRVCHVVEVNNSLSENFTFGVYLGAAADRGQVCLYPVKAVTWHRRVFHQISCPIILREFDNSKCSLKCLFQEVPKATSGMLMSGERECLHEGPSATRHTVWSYLALRGLFQLSLYTACVLVDLALISVVSAARGRHRFHRLWSLVATAILTPLSGLSIDLNNLDVVPPEYNKVFYAFAGLVGTSILLISTLDLESTNTPSPSQILKGIPSLLLLPEVVVLLMVILVLGCISGFLESFLFWFLTDLSSPYYVLGLAIGIGAAVGLPFLLMRSKKIVLKLGPVNLIVFALLAQSIRCIGYFYLDLFWWSLLLEMLEAVTFHTLWISVSVYTADLVPKALWPTMQSCMGTVHYGLGRGIGAFLGGSIMSIFGFRTAFLVMGSGGGACGILYFLLYHGLLKRCRNKQGDSQDPLQVEKGHEENDVANTEQISRLLEVPVENKEQEHKEMTVLEVYACLETRHEACPV